VITDDVAAAVFDSLPTPIAVLGPDGTVVRLNEAWRRSAATGVALLPVRPGMSWLLACDHALEAATRSGDTTPAPPSRARSGGARDAAAPIRMLAAMSRQMIDRRRTRARLELPHPAVPGQRWLDVRLSTLVRGDGLIVVVDDVTDRHDREDDLRRQSRTDPITGLPNRTALRTLLATRLTATTAADDARTTATMPSTRLSPAVLFLDLDAFRHINNSLGYTIGDAVLHACARRFTTVLEPTDVIGRWDGDEFVVLTDSGSAPAAAELAERLAATLDEPLDVDGHRIQLSVSIGVALAAASSSSPRKGPAGKGSPRPASRRAALESTEAGDALVARAGAEVIRARSRSRKRSDRRSRSTP
jgi:diguanylate cyclase (GGDEF)-like protein